MTWINHHITKDFTAGKEQQFFYNVFLHSVQICQKLNTEQTKCNRSSAAEESRYG